MDTYTAVIERCSDTGLYVGYIPGFSAAHSQAETLEELNENLQEVLSMVLEEGSSLKTSEFVGTQVVKVA